MSEIIYYGGSNKRPGSFIKSQKDFHPGRFLFQAARKMIVVPWHQNMNDRSGILNRFIDQENLQMYAQMDGILFCHWNNTHSIVLTNGKIHLVIFNCLVLVYYVVLQLQSDGIPTRRPLIIVPVKG